MIKNGVLIMFSLFALGQVSAAFAASDAEAVKSLFLKGEYRPCATAGMRLLSAGKSGEVNDEVCYITGLSCLKSGDPSGASRAFEALLRDFRHSKLAEEARVGIADSAYLRGDLRQAQSKYEAFLTGRPGSKLRPGLYYRLYLIAKRDGKFSLAQQYKDKIRAEFPRSPEADMERDIFPAENLQPAQPKSLIIPAEDIDNLPRNLYSIQVGAFSKKANADALAHKLVARGYSAYVESVITHGTKQIFKVRVGQLDNYAQAREIERKLSRDGYPTKIDRQ